MIKPYLKQLYAVCLIMASTIGYAQVKVVVSGVDKVIENNIQAHLSTIQIECTATDQLANSYEEKIAEKVIKATKPFGYYQPLVNIQLKRLKECWSINLDIELGQPITLRTKDIKVVGGSERPEIFNQLINKSKIYNSQSLRDSEYEQLKLELKQLASELGYLDAVFIKNQIDVYPKKSVADVALHFNPGVRYRIENINIHLPESFLKPQFVKKLIDLKEGDFLSQSQLYEVRTELSATNYFDQISIVVDSDQRAGDVVPVSIHLTPGNRIKYSAGAGYSTDTGPRATLEYRHDRFSEFGYQFKSKLSVADVTKEFSSGIKFPSKSKPSSKWMNFDIGFQTERTDVLSSDTAKVGVSETKIHKNKWQNINYIDWVDETFVTGTNENESTLLVPGTSWSLIKTDNPIFPTKGYKLFADIKGASSSAFSDVSFVQLTFDFKAIQPIGLNHRLIYKAKVGGTVTSEFDKLPATYRFFTGGDTTIRGFDYETLAPINDDGDVIGGKHVALAGIEYEHRFRDQWAWAVFTDVGNAFSDKFEIEKSVGAGIRWFSPIGAVRFDVGVPIESDLNDYQIHITLGPDF